MGVMAAKQSATDGSRKESPEHWVIELIRPVVLRVTFGFELVKGRVSEMTIGHKQMKPTSHCVNFRNMVLEFTRLTYLKEITWQIYYIPPVHSAWDSCHTSPVLLARNSSPLGL